ncbi:MAG: DUF1080 domain-containing protein [Bacteroidota bacterium]|nr:DUF1080 domain-containing protein [Bacteroidota bacterium]
MKSTACSLLFVVCAMISTTIFAQHNYIPLYNEKDFMGWDSYIGPPLDSTGKKLTEVPVGLNNDPNHVFTIVDDNNEKVIRISGENFGAISTQNEYSNYHLQLMFKWGKLSWGQKKNKKKDGGLLYHSVGKQGADYDAWMRSQEFQIEEGNCGDYWGVAGGMTDIPVIKKSDSEYVYNASGQLATFSENSKVGRHCIKQGDAENASGEWNTLDLYCYGDTSVHVINGKLMMVLYHSSQLDNGQVLPLIKGKLQLQSEGSEIFFKHIIIEPIAAIPTEFLK